jgi:hypothetical protein
MILDLNLCMSIDEIIIMIFMGFRNILLRLLLLYILLMELLYGLLMAFI